MYFSGSSIKGQMEKISEGKETEWEMGEMGVFLMRCNRKPCVRWITKEAGYV